MSPWYGRKKTCLRLAPAGLSSYESGHFIRNGEFAACPNATIKFRPPMGPLFQFVVAKVLWRLVVVVWRSWQEGMQLLVYPTPWYWKECE